MPGRGLTKESGEKTTFKSEKAVKKLAREFHLFQQGRRIGDTVGLLPDHRPNPTNFGVSQCAWKSRLC